MDIELGQEIAKLRKLNKPVPKPLRLPTKEEIELAEKQLGIRFHPELIEYLLNASDVVYGALEPITMYAESGYTYILHVVENARSIGVPENLLPICCDNADYYCMNEKGSIVFWSHDKHGLNGEYWKDLATWIEEVWIGEN
jgi:hypothetical protein